MTKGYMDFLKKTKKDELDDQTERNTNNILKRSMQRFLN